MGRLTPAHLANGIQGASPSRQQRHRLFLARQLLFSCRESIPEPSSTAIKFMTRLALASHGAMVSFDPLGT